MPKAKREIYAKKQRPGEGPLLGKSFLPLFAGGTDDIEGNDARHACAEEHGHDHGAVFFIGGKHLCPFAVDIEGQLRADIGVVAAVGQGLLIGVGGGVGFCLLIQQLVHLRIGVE